MLEVAVRFSFGKATGSRPVQFETVVGSGSVSIADWYRFVVVSIQVRVGFVFGQVKVHVQFRR